ncbi:MAG TPA: thioredoxin domain-containing protein [Anaerolineales bacterium]|nr:thioredoxin domain-containing protein [Anaerolineales bacterium]
MPARSKKVIEPEVEPEIKEEPAVVKQPEDTVTFKRSHFYSILTVLSFAVGVLLGYVVWGFDSGAEGTQTAQTAVQSSGQIAEAPVTPEPQFIRYDVPSEGFPSIGPADAPITIVEFSDYQCPFCRRWHDEVYEPLLAAYPGQIRMVYRHLPLTSIHPDAFAAAEAAMCAGDQDAYWPYHEKLFGSESLGMQNFVQYAEELSLNVNDFQACMTEHKFKEAVEADSDFAVNLGVRSTPTFFINGLAIVGAQPLDVFKQVIDKELAGEIPQE